MMCVILNSCSPTVWGASTMRHGRGHTRFTMFSAFIATTRLMEVRILLSNSETGDWAGATQMTATWSSKNPHHTGVRIEVRSTWRGGVGDATPTLNGRLFKGGAGGPTQGCLRPMCWSAGIIKGVCKGTGCPLQNRPSKCHPPAEMLGETLKRWMAHRSSEF